MKAPEPMVARLACRSQTPAMEDPTAELANAIAELKNTTAQRHAARRGTPEHDDLVREEERLRKRVMSLADDQTRLRADG